MITKANVECHSEGVTGEGPVPCRVMLIGIAPGKTEFNKPDENGIKHPFIGPAGKLQNATLKAVGVEREDVYLTNLICWYEDSPTEDEIAGCNERLQKEIELVNPKIIVLLGNIVQDWYFQGRKHRRGRLYFDYEQSRWYLPTYHPSAFLYQGHKLDIADYARDLMKLTLDLPDYPPEPSYNEARSVEEAEAILWSLQGLTAIDIESSFDGKPFVYPPEGLVGDEDNKLLCFSVSNEQGTWVIPGRYIADVTKGWGSRNEVQWAMQGGMFDKAKMKMFLGEELEIKEDTLLGSYSLDERGGANEEDEKSVGIHGLKGLANEFLGAEEYDVNVLTAAEGELHLYNAKDAFFTRTLVPIFKKRQEQDNVRDMYESILIPGANMLSEIQAYGVYVDQKVLFELGAKWSKRWLELYEELLQGARDLGWEGDINLNSPPQLVKLLFDILKVRPSKLYGRSSRKEVLETLKDKIPWCATLSEWRGINHILNTYIVGVEDDIKRDGRCHPEPLLHGTRTGRLSYKKPPIGTIPKHGVNAELAEIRRIFAASKGKVLINADLKQAELYATAYLSNDKTMLNALKSGDAHGSTAKAVFEDVDEAHAMWKAYRELGKLFNFGTLYNRTAKGYADNPFQGRQPPQGLENYTLTRRQAQIIIDKQFENWPDVKAWQKEQTREAFDTGEQVTLTGRKRRYWLPNFKTVNQSVNVGPQSLAHDYLFHSMMKLHSGYDFWHRKTLEEAKLTHANILFEVHDSLLIEADENYVDETIEEIKAVMTEPKFGLPGIPCDIEIGPNWYEVKKI